MACTLIDGGIVKDCENNIGGVAKIYITDFDSVASITAANYAITAITMDSGTVFYEFQFNKYSSSFEENTVVNVENGGVYFEQTVTLIIPRRDSTKMDALNSIIAGVKNLSVIVKDSNGINWLLGEAAGINVTEIVSGSGKAQGDLNGYTITMSGAELAMAQTLSNSVLATVI